MLFRKMDVLCRRVADSSWHPSKFQQASFVKLYHGTSETVAREAMRVGLKPRSHTGKNNWRHSIESHPNLVYLTVAYAPYFAANAVGQSQSRPAIIEVETDLLNRTRLRPDEDFVAEALQQQQGAVRGQNEFRKLTREVLSSIDGYARYWKQSLQCLGNCAHKGPIPVSAITRVAFIDAEKAAGAFHEAQDPVISVTNFRYFGNRHRLLTRWFAGYEVAAEEIICADEFLKMLSATPEKRNDIVEHWTKVLAATDALEIVIVSNPKSSFSEPAKNCTV